MDWFPIVCPVLIYLVYYTLLDIQADILYLKEDIRVREIVQGAGTCFACSQPILISITISHIQSDP